MDKTQIDSVPGIFPTWQVHANSFAIRNSYSNIGTGFTVLYEDIEYLVTAQHVLSGVSEQGTIEVLKDKQWEKFTVESVHNSGNDELDIVALKLSGSLINGFFTPCKISESNEDLIAGCDAVYAGFPASWMTSSSDFICTYSTSYQGYPYPMPFIKRSYICYFGSINDTPHFFIDGVANKGFSGSPVYVTKMRKEKDHIKTWNEIIGVIVKHKFDSGAIYNPQTKKQNHDKAQVYSGVSVAHGIFGLFNNNFKNK